MKARNFLLTCFLTITLLLAGCAATPANQASSDGHSTSERSTADLTQQPAVPTPLETSEGAPSSSTGRPGSASTEVTDSSSTHATGGSASTAVGTTVAPGDAQLHFINTGNSDAILIQADGLFALIDGGDNDDEQTVVRYLQDQSVTTLAYVFATHLHADHIGGLDAVANNFPIGTLLVSNGDADTRTYSDFITAMANRGVNPSVPLPGSTYALGTTSIQVLSAADTDDVNDNSLVLEWTNGADNALFLGDASSTIETRLQVADSIELIKIGHHGSSTSTDPTFLRALNPDYAVITAGAGNSYGHPHQETVTTLQDQAIELHRTDECGTILFTSTGSGLSTTSAPASYAAGANSTGAKPSTSGNPAKGGTSLAPLPSSPSATNPSSATPLAADQTETQTDDTTQTVYWTPNGEVYHTTDKCSSFSRSKTILSGTIQDSGKPRVCKICG